MEDLILTLPIFLKLRFENCHLEALTNFKIVNSNHVVYIYIYIYNNQYSIKFYGLITLRLCLVIVFFFFSKTCFGEYKEKKNYFIFEIKNMFG